MNKEYNVAPNLKNNVNKKDKKFYRKRVFNLTKELLSNEEPSHLFPDVKQAFDNFTNHCINYFKAIDCSDILQEDYKDISMNHLLYNADEFKPFLFENAHSGAFSSAESDCATRIFNARRCKESAQIQDDANKLMMRSINIQPSTLDKFITRRVKK